MKSGIIFIIALFFSIQPCFAQKNNMFIPLNYKKAYTNKSRTLEGKPGPNYWQNSADYKINAELIPEKYLLKGSEEITYKNNSPAKLTSLVIRLYQDMFRKGVPHDEDIDPADITDGVAIQKLVINGEEIDFNSKGTFKPQRNGTNLKLVLKKFIEPKSECKIEIEWSFTIQQKTHERMGAYTPNSFFIGYWYPQIAVYDDIDGWDEHQYGGRVEFYNDFNNYDVNIKLPYNYIAWATGILQNGKDNFTKELLDKIDEAKKSDRIINIIKKEDIEKNRVLLNAPYHTWHYVAENVPDFAFAAGDKMLWNASTVKLPDGRETFVSAINDSSTHFCDDVAYYARKAIGFYSTKLPGIPFPYPCETIFNFSGPGGMEFPMMANDGISPDINNNVMVTVHEIAHTYMPFYMGINERKYAWMDEGWAVMLTYYSEADILP